MPNGFIVSGDDYAGFVDSASLVAAIEKEVRAGQRLRVALLEMNQGAHPVDRLPAGGGTNATEHLAQTPRNSWRQRRFQHRGHVLLQVLDISGAG